MKRKFWALRSELKVLAFGLIAAIPGRLGMHARRALLPHFLGQLGHMAVIQRGFRVTSAEQIRIGNHCNFGHDAYIAGGGGVTIGDWVGFGPDVKVWSINHRFEDPDVPWQLQGWDRKPVVIEDDVWLGANVFVVPGITIGRGAIVSAGTIVNKSVPAFALVAGNPGRVVGWRKRPDFDALAQNENTAGSQ